MNGNHLRKIRNPRTVLDLATGTGAWAVDIAQEFATADEVVGVDIKSVAPIHYPSNCRFEVRITCCISLTVDRGRPQRYSIS
jgi:23S rRNA U2552 (ribose-2'-O)-methylase RlmE/FtsJ